MSVFSLVCGRIFPQDQVMYGNMPVSRNVTGVHLDLYPGGGGGGGGIKYFVRKVGNKVYLCVRIERFT